MSTNPPENDAALALIRQKLANIYGTEPDASQELAEAEAPLPAGQHHSKHQRFMQTLHASGKPMSQIQTEWHSYYQALPDNEKHEVWQEFYSQSARARQQASRIQPTYQYQPDTPTTETTATAEQEEPSTISDQRTDQPVTESHASEPAAQTSNPLYGHPTSPVPTDTPTQQQAASPDQIPAKQLGDDPQTAPTQQADLQHRPTASSLRQKIRQTAGSRGKLKAKHHIQSLIFGLGFGGLVVIIILFSFFNEVVIAPFIQPSRTVTATPIIVSPDGATPSQKNEVVIPKINVQIPLDFSAQSTEEKAFEAALDKGVAHYPTTALPGQQGNASFFGHSSNNIFNPGQYKFAFVLLNELVPGDTFYLTYNGVAYTYQVYDKQVVAADAVEILNPVPDKKATAMLVTCDPPGTTLRRLAIWGEQISPNPNSNPVASAPAAGADTTSTTQTKLPGNGPTLWKRLVDFVTGN